MQQATKLDVPLRIASGGDVVLAGSVAISVDPTLRAVVGDALLQALVTGRSLRLARMPERTRSNAHDAWTALLRGDSTLLYAGAGDGTLVLVARAARRAPMFASLDARDWKLLDGLANGDAQKQIAHDMGVVTSTISRRMSRLRQRLGIGTQLELVRWATQHARAR